MWRFHGMAAAPGRGQAALQTKKARTWTEGPESGGPDPAPLPAQPTPDAGVGIGILGYCLIRNT